MSKIPAEMAYATPKPALWRITYSHEVPVRVPGPASSVDTVFSHFEKAVGQFDMVATTAGLALETFNVEYPSHVYTRTSDPERICYVDAITLTAKHYGGHFS